MQDLTTYLGFAGAVVSFVTAVVSLATVITRRRGQRNTTD